VIYWVFGLPGSGKSTVGKSVADYLGAVFLDADEVRTVFPDLGYTEKDRLENNMRLLSLATMINSQGFDVVVSAITPLSKFRREYLYRWTTVYLKCDVDECRKRKPEVYTDFPLCVFQEPDGGEKVDFVVDTCELSLVETLELIFEGWR